VAGFVPLANGVGVSSNSSSSLERFRSESFMISPPCLRSDLFKHLIVVCPCARIACALMPWFKRFEHPTIRSVEDCFFGLPACHLLIWTTLAANALIVLLDVCKFLDLDLYVILYVVFSCSFCCPCCFFGLFCFFVLLYFLAWCFVSI
jgi:hypothetical protein